MNKLKSLFAVSLITVQYTLPVPAPLTQYGQFKISGVQEVTNGSHVEVSYPLPSELTGSSGALIELQGDFTKGQPLILQGDHASATCSADQYGEIAQCQIAYRDLSLNSAAINDFLSRTISDPAELKARLQVANIFASEPVGVLTYISSP